MKKSGCIYIMTNPSFQEWVKIGYADDVEKRLADLNGSSAVPFSFRLYATLDVDERLSDCKYLHKLLDMVNSELRSVEKDEDGKVKRRREFFCIPPEDAYEILECIAGFSHGRLVRYDPSKEQKDEDKTADRAHAKFQATVDARLLFWAQFIEHTRTNQEYVKLFPGSRKPTKDHWYDLPIGTSRAHIALTINTRQNGIAVELYIPRDKKFYNELQVHSEEINAAVCPDLEWQPLEEKDASRIILRKEMGDFRQFDDAKRKLAFEWLSSTAILFKRTFSRYI